MTILSKLDTTWSDVKGPLVPNEVPPTYEESEASTSLGFPSDLPPATNWYAIDKTHGAVEGTYNIDTELTVPSSLRSPQGSTPLPNLSLHCYHGAVSSKVYLTSGSSSPARLEIGTKNGSVNAQFLARKNKQIIHARCKSYNGSVHVQIPRDFHGIVTGSTKNGTVGLSAELQRIARPINGNKWFVGDWSALHASDAKEWDGDEVVGETWNGSVVFGFVGEKGPLAVFFDSVASWFK